MYECCEIPVRSCGKELGPFANEEEAEGAAIDAAQSKLLGTGRGVEWTQTYAEAVVVHGL